MDTKELLNFGITSSAQNTPVPQSDNAQKVLKDYVAVTNILKKQRNNLLGVFDENGKYSIKDEAILLQLLALPKKFDRKENGVVYACSQLGSFILNFKIVFEIDPSFCKAQLFLIEVEHCFEEDKKHLTLLDTQENIYSSVFKEEIYKLWKVYLEEEVYDKDDFLSTYLKNQQETYEFNEELVEILAQLYLIRMLKVLENCGEIGEKVKAEYKQIIDKMLAEDPGIAQNYIKLKIVLDHVVEKHGAMAEIMKTQEGIAVLSGYINPMKRVLSPATVVTELGKTSIEAEKEKKEEKTNSASKPKAKAKAKSKGSKSKPVKAFDVSKVFGGGKKKDDKKKEEAKPLPTGPIKLDKSSAPAPVRVVESKPVEKDIDDLFLSKMAEVAGKSAKGWSDMTLGKGSSLSTSDGGRVATGSSSAIKAKTEKILEI